MTSSDLIGIAAIIVSVVTAAAVPWAYYVGKTLGEIKQELHRLNQHEKRLDRLESLFTTRSSFLTDHES